jgi:hypothetical protein
MKRPFLAAAMASALMGILVGVRGAQSTDARVARCGGGTSVAAVFDIARAADVWKYLPAMMQAPELEDESGPASVVVYRGAWQGLLVGRTGLQAGKVQGAVCVLTQSGEVNVYSDVNMAGFQAP